MLNFVPATDRQRKHTPRKHCEKKTLDTTEVLLSMFVDDITYRIRMVNEMKTACLALKRHIRLNCIFKGTVYHLITVTRKVISIEE